MNFRENPSSVSRDVSCIQMDGQTGMTKLIAAFLNYVNPPTYDVMRRQPKATLQHSELQYAINAAFQIREIARILRSGR